MGPGRWWASGVILGYLAVQVLVPIRGLTRTRAESAGTHSWNMYAYAYGCNVLYTLTTASGETIRIPVDRYLNLPPNFHLVLHADALPHFDEFLCRELRAQGITGEVRANIECVENVGDETTVMLADPSRPRCR
jgi:extradiol dioxygenase family protein